MQFATVLRRTRKKQPAEGTITKPRRTMQVRCFKCKSTFRVPFGVSHAGRVLACTDCGARHAQRATAEALSDPRKHEELSRTFAEVSGIDIPGANAVLLGIMSLRQAQELQDTWGYRANLLLRGRPRRAPGSASR